jgi:D-alanine transaminase
VAGAAHAHTKEASSMADLACLNGEMMPVDEARVHVWDRGFLFGDSVYEVFRMYHGRRWLEEEHLARLRRSLKALDFAPYDFEQLVDRMDRTARASGIAEGTLYVQITRGVAPRSHPFPDPPCTPTELIVVRPYDDAPTAELRSRGARVLTHPDLRWKRCDIKSTNLLANVLAIEAARRAGCDEAVLLDSKGFVTEATHSSLLWVRQGRLEGTPEGHEILPGMTRQLILRLARALEISFSGAHVKIDELASSSEVILVGTASEVLPVVRIDDRTIGEGRPGPVACRLGDAYRQEVERWLARQPGST